MKVAVMGAGGIGGYVGARLAEAGAEVSLIARGAHLAALKANGLRLESPLGDVRADVVATDDPGSVGPVDIVLFAVKLGDTDAAAAAIGPMVGPQTRVVTLQNGIDAKGMIGRHVPEGQIAAGIIYLAAYIKEPGVIFSPGGVHRSVVDGLGGDATMARLFALAPRLVGLELSATDQIERVLWDKFIALAAFSAATSLARVPVGVIYNTPALLDFFRQLLTENAAVAAAEGVAFPASLPEDKIALLSGQPGTMKSSMLVDLEAGKALELPWLSGRVVALGAKHGLPTPANSAVVAALSPYVAGPPRLPE